MARNKKFSAMPVWVFIAIIITCIVLFPIIRNLVLGIRNGTATVVIKIDFKKNIEAIAQNRDSLFYEIINSSITEAQESKLDIYKVMGKNCKNVARPLNTYFGQKGQSDDEIILMLQNTTVTAFEECLQVIKRRLKAFGVHITKINRFGKYSYSIFVKYNSNVKLQEIIEVNPSLELRLVCKPRETMVLLQELDRALTYKNTIGFNMVDLFLPEYSVVVKPVVEVERLFNSEQNTSQGDSMVLVDNSILKKYPLFSLLIILKGSDTVHALTENISSVVEILAKPEIKMRIPENYEFLWSFYSRQVENLVYSNLYHVKREPALSLAVIKNAFVYSHDESEAKLIIQLNDKDAEAVHRIISENRGRKLAVVLGEEVIGTPIFADNINGNQVNIAGFASKKDAERIALLLFSGTYKVPLDIAVIQE